ncbi:MAG TPA: class I SAM-dependent methyltransferase [Bryobacteraceae bacterium]|nr:class I SAM-dependent methyltransferase [Bryobacteraceae bacterium]
MLQEGHPLAGGYAVALCATCGFVYADTGASQRDYDRFYASFSKYEDAAHSTGSGESEEDRGRLEGTARILEGFLPSREARILDIGCAAGGLLAALQRRGYSQLTGIDPSPACVHHTRAKTGAAFQGSLTKLPAGMGPFHCVILNHVLEHVLDVSGALSAARRLLEPGGILYVEVPDALRYADYVYAPFQDFNTEHINHFSRHGLNSTAARHGFSAIGGGGRLLHASPDTFTPAVYGIYRHTGAPCLFAQDRALRPAILRYIERSAALLREIDSRIAEAVDGSPELLVWGAGQLTLKLLSDSSLARARVAAFIDSNPIHQGRRLAGAPILAPQELAAYSQPILVGTLLHHKQILAQIRALRLSNRIILLPEGGPKFYGEAQG